MKTDKNYESPMIQTISIDVEAVFCVSPVYGEEGTAGYYFFGEDDIYDGGSF
jgi:hypothetical protein